ncbi:MAG: ABC transporter permease [Bacillota bacterium]
MNVWIQIVAIVAALLLVALLLFALGLDVPEAFGALLAGSFGSASAIGETIVKMTPLIFTGLSFALASRCGLINIGGEGQLYVGGLCATVVGLYLHLPAPLHILFAVLAGFVGGALWGMLAAALKVRFGASELITTIMLNYIGNYLVNYLVTGPMIEVKGNQPQTALVDVTAQFPRLISGTRIHLGIVIAILCIVIYYIFLWHTKTGFQTRVVGLNPNAAKYAGINNNRRTLMAMFIAGGFSGLAGVVEILGIQLRLYQDFSPGYGFDGIAVALLGQNSPIGILFSALLFGAMRAGSNQMQIRASVPVALVYVFQAIVIVLVIASQYLAEMRKHWAIRKQAEGDQQDGLYC